MQPTNDNCHHTPLKSGYEMELIQRDGTHPKDRERISLFYILSGNDDLYAKSRYTGQIHIFTGLLKCGDCGKSMAYTNPRSVKNPHAFYACANAKRNGKDACTYHYTRYDHLYELVLQDIRKQVKRVKLGDEEFIQYLTKANQQRKNAKVKKMTMERAKSNKRFAELDLIIKRLYEDNVLGKTSDERFMILTKSYEKEQSDLKETFTNLDEELAEIEIQNLNS